MISHWLSQKWSGIWPCLDFCTFHEGIKHWFDIFNQSIICWNWKPQPWNRSQFYDEAGMGSSAAPNIFSSWLRWKTCHLGLSLEMSSQLLQLTPKQERHEERLKWKLRKTNNSWLNTRTSGGKLKQEKNILNTEKIIKTKRPKKKVHWRFSSDWHFRLGWGGQTYFVTILATLALFFFCSHFRLLKYCNPPTHSNIQWTLKIFHINIALGFHWTSLGLLNPTHTQFRKKSFGSLP